MTHFLSKWSLYTPTPRLPQADHERDSCWQIIFTATPIGLWFICWGRDVWKSLFNAGHYWNEQTYSISLFLTHPHTHTNTHKHTCTNPISIKVGTLSKNAIKTKNCNLLDHLNFYLTNFYLTFFSVFSQTDLIVFSKYKKQQNATPETNSKKLGQRQNKTEKVRSNTVLERSTISSLTGNRWGYQDCKQGWVMVHHFVPNFVRKLPVSSKTMFLSARLQRM